MVEVLLLTAILASQTSDCSGHRAIQGACVDGSLGGGGATLDGTLIGRGGDPTVELDDSGSGGRDDERDPGLICAREFRTVCDFEFFITPPPGAGAITLADIASFRADSGAVRTEPSQWAVVNLPMNAISTARTHIVDGTLLGQAASVRFTPVAWNWDYGDGGTRRTSTGGARWAELSLDEFAATATSHIYRERGQRLVTLGVDFLAHYRLGSGDWIAIPGVLSVPAAGPAGVLSTGVRTVLVAHTCDENPRGPGC